MSQPLRVGFVGVGTIVEALITGMCASGEQRANILLSPRNAVTARRLAERIPFAQVAADNQSVLDGSDIVFLGVTPQVAVEVLRTLKFRADHCVVSLIATFDLPRLRTLASPAAVIVRATPVPAVAQRLGALAIYPYLAQIATVLEGLGALVVVESEAQLDAIGAVTALMSSYFGMLAEVTAWLRRQGLDDAAARSYVASTFHSLGATAQARITEGFDELIAEHTTAGGLNEQVLRELRAAGWTALISESLDLIHDRIQGRATYEDRLPVNRQ